MSTPPCACVTVVLAEGPLGARVLFGCGGVWGYDLPTPFRQPFVKDRGHARGLELTELHLQARNVPWNQVFLDPHNPRLVQIDMGEQSTRIPDSQIVDERLQVDLFNKLRTEVGIDDVVQKISKLGFLTIDGVVVRPLLNIEDAYVVLEGNRRIAALKAIHNNPRTLLTLSDQVKASLEAFEVLVYEGDDEDIAWDLQGLRHMSGVKAWGPFQQARFLVELKERRQLPVTELADVSGLGRTTVGRLLRSYYGFQQATQDGDWGDQVSEQDFSVFQEAVFQRNNSPLWKWLKWDDEEYRFTDSERLSTLLGLLKDASNGGPRIPRVNPDLVTSSQSCSLRSARSSWSHS